MARYTTTLFEIIESELHRQGFNEFVNNGKLTMNDNEFQFIQKVLRFDDDVKKIVDETFFKGFKFNDERIDRYFKQSFVTRFLDREISRQTVEAFASQVLYLTIQREDYIYTVFGQELYKYLENHVDSDSNGTQNQTSEETSENTQKENSSRESNSSNNSTNDTRDLTSTLPQNQINLDVNNDQLEYGDENTISKNKVNGSDERNEKGNRDVTGNSSSNGNQDVKTNENSLTKTYTMENLDKLYHVRERIFDDYDRKCFLQIW